MAVQPLWEEDNETVCSSVFAVPPGKVCILRSIGMGNEKYRTDPLQPRVKQAMCVNQILFDDEVRHSYTACPCGWVYKPSGVSVPILMECPVFSNGCAWVLSCSHNLAIIGVPGTYRLTLNDPTAIGEAQVYAELVSQDQIAPQVAHLFF